MFHVEHFSNSAAAPPLPCNPRPPFVIVGRRKSVLPKLLLPWGDMKKNVTITVNGMEQRAPVEPRLLLVHFLRENAGLTGTHVGCETSLCGACTVLMDGRAVKSCTVLAVQADGHKSPPSKAWPMATNCIPSRRILGGARPAVRVLHARHDHVYP